MTRLNRLTGFAIALAGTVALAGASTVRMTAHASQDSVLRLAWTARPERVEDCRPQSEEALAKLPPHMRQAVICEGTTASYRLVVRREGAVILDQIVRGGGLRHDRSLYVFRDVPVPAGTSAISVQFDRVDATTTESGAQPRSEATLPGSGVAGMAIDPARRRRELEERTRQRAEAVPPSLVFQRRLCFVPSQVILVTYDPDRRELIARDAPPKG
jgi:hypothetical protein